MSNCTSLWKWTLPLSVLFVLLFGAPAFCQDLEEQVLGPKGYPTPEEQAEWERNNPDRLPHWMTPEELLRRDEIGKGFMWSAPPAGDKRQPGEFEPMQGVLICYPFGISYPLIAEMSEDVEVVTIVANSSQQNTVTNNYQNQGVNMSNVSFLIAPSDSYWTRDYGPWFIINSTPAQGIVDFIYNRPRPNDDDIPTEYGQDQGIPIYNMALESAGGNYMCDGQGIGCSTNLVWSENNGMSHSQIDQMVEDYMGITNYHVIPDALGEYIKHIDCWAKFLGPDKIMILEVPSGHSQYDEFEDAIDYWAAQTSCYGTPYEISRVYSPSGQPYTNSLILNDKVLVPITGSGWDDDAIASYEAAMPGYEVLGFTGSWNSTDALHCRTMGITDREMLYIDHTPLRNGAPLAGGFAVDAEIIRYSGQAFTGGTPTIYWKTTGGWNTVAMSNVGGDNYQGLIPSQPDGTTIAYYIYCEDASGRVENHPYIGAADAHTFDVASLGADASTVSVRHGGTVNFSLNAGTANGLRTYLILGSLSGSAPGIPLPGGLATLPVNWDSFTDYALAKLNSATFTNFLGTLNGEGLASAQLNFGPLDSKHLGKIMSFAYCLEGNPNWDFASNAVTVEVTN